MVQGTRPRAGSAEERMPGARVSRRAVSPGPRRSPTPLLTRIRATAASAAPSTASCSRSGAILHAGEAARPIPRLHTCGSAAAQPRLPPAERQRQPGARRPQRRRGQTQPRPGSPRRPQRPSAARRRICNCMGGAQSVFGRAGGRLSVPP